MMWKRSFILLGLLFITPYTPAAEPPALKGTWVRELVVGQQIGNQIVVNFTPKRVHVRMTSGGRLEDGKIGWVTLEFDGEYATTSSGLICGVVTGVKADVSKIPDMDSMVDPLGKSIHKIIAEPFCFRVNHDDDCLYVTDIKIPVIDIGNAANSPNLREMISVFASGKYTSSPTDQVPLPKLKSAQASDFNLLNVLAALSPVKITQYSSDPVKPVVQVSGQSLPPVPPTPSPIYPHPVPNVIPPAAPVVYQQATPPVMAASLVDVPLTWSTPVPVMNKPLPSLEGTWVREMVMPDAGGAAQFVFTFKGDRLTVKLLECGYSDGDDKMKSAGIELECTYHLSSDGYLLGRVVGVELDLKNAPMDDSMSPELMKGISKVYGEPFCFRCEMREGVIAVADLRIPTLDGLGDEGRQMRDAAVGFLSGKYKKSDSAVVSLPKLEKPKDGVKMKQPQRVQIQNVPTLSVCPPGMVCPPPLRPNALPVLSEPVSNFSNDLPMKQAIIPTAAQLLPPGSMKNAPMMPMVKDAWYQSTTPPAFPPAPVPPAPVPLIPPAR